MVRFQRSAARGNRVGWWWGVLNLLFRCSPARVERDSVPISDCASVGGRFGSVATQTLRLGAGRAQESGGPPLARIPAKLT
jgi:hypothetical protein